MNTKKTLCFVAGKSGGHILPALTLSEYNKKEYPNTTHIFFSTDSDLDMQLLSSDKTIDTHIPLHIPHLPKHIWQYPYFIKQALSVFLHSRKLLKKYAPEKIITTGGFVSIPLCLAARSLSIPIELWELNALPGRATQFIARFANTIHCCFDSCIKHFKKENLSLSAYPLRFKHQELTHEQACKKIGFSDHKKTLLILGGSQGSLQINRTIQEWITQNNNNPVDLQIIHQTGSHDTTNWTEFYKQLGIKSIVFPYTHCIAPYYQAADLVVSRAGAGTLFETVFFKKRALILPLLLPNNTHQKNNGDAIMQQYPSLFTMPKNNENPIKLLQQEYDKIPITLK